MKIKVIYPVRPEWNESERREYDVGDVDAGSPEEACEMMFAGFNNVIEDPQLGECGYWSNKFRIRSMSVGDLVEVDGVLYRCMAMGFKKVAAEEEIPAGMGLS